SLSCSMSFFRSITMNAIDQKDLVSASRFAVSSHASSAEMSALSTPAPAEAPSKSPFRGKVLVVEDDHNARRAIVRILRLSNFAPLEAQTVKEAIDKLAQRPQWVLLDLMLPDGNGSQVLKRIVSEGLDIRVCLTTGCSSTMIDPLRNDVAHVFTKPLDVR